ncbi:uncharacterized protein LOC128450156 isoform X1 [Pleuronectes platessa]|uniref:uncharacterized protein LOC128450156 isoform X1 n=1 Tax=Pleuronectes platessa TaxID=8262 RepID=UPI00232A407B|nr:uncharacterized protein LOC128450156 isoform X1 [Pleuronectes platessa]
MLSCFSHSFPPVQHYSWYRKSQGEEQDELVSEHQNHTVYSNQSGVYYCIAKNVVDQSLSDPVHLFEPTGNYLDILKFLVPALLVLMIIILIVIVLRLRRKKSIQQGTTNAKSPSGFSEQLSRPDAPEHQPLPDSTYDHTHSTHCPHPGQGSSCGTESDMDCCSCYSQSIHLCSISSDMNSTMKVCPVIYKSHSLYLPFIFHRPPTDINLVYSILNLPQVAPQQNPTRRQAGNTKEDSVNYAPLNFKNNLKKKQRKVEEDPVYAKVSKPTRVKKKEPESLQDYENISDAASHAPTSPNLFDDHTSEGEVELHYSKVRFTATPRRQTTNRDSSSSEEDESLYSNVRI